MRSYAVKNWSDFEKLEVEWNELLVNSDSDSIFLTWEWISSWVEIHRAAKPYIIVIRDSADKLVGLAPLYHCRMRAFKLAPLKCLCILGDIESGSDYLDFIISKKESGKIASTIMRHLKQNRNDWDLIWMPKMSGWNNSVQMIADACIDNNINYVKRQTEFSSIPLDCSFDDYLLKFSRKHREQIRRQKRKVFKNDVTIYHCESADEVSSYQDDLFRLNHKRWMLLGDPGTFVRKPNEKKFYQSFVLKAFKKGWLQYYRLSDSGEVKAIQLGYLYNNIFHQMQEGFDPDYINGVGNVLRLNVMQKCFNNNTSEYDFLGGHSEHKRRWGAIIRKGYDLLIANNKLLPELLVKHRVWPSGRYITTTTKFS